MGQPSTLKVYYPKGSQPRELKHLSGGAGPWGCGPLVFSNTYLQGYFFDVKIVYNDTLYSANSLIRRRGAGEELREIWLP